MYPDMSAPTFLHHFCIPFRTHGKVSTRNVRFHIMFTCSNIYLKLKMLTYPHKTIHINTNINTMSTNDRHKFIYKYYKLKLTQINIKLKIKYYKNNLAFYSSIFEDIFYTFYTPESINKKTVLPNSSKKYVNFS